MQQKKDPSEGAGKSTEGEQHTKALFCNPAFVLSTGDPVTSEAAMRDAQNGRTECLEHALFLPRDMQELKNMRKREVVLSLKRDLAKICLLHLNFQITCSYPLC